METVDGSNLITFLRSWKFNPFRSTISYCGNLEILRYKQIIFSRFYFKDWGLDGERNLRTTIKNFFGKYN